MTDTDSKMVIAIDGYSSCGKSTVAKDLAKILNIIFIDSGAMYRCVTLYALEHGIIKGGEIDQVLLQEALSNITISFKFDAQAKSNETYLNGKLVEDQIRGIDVSNHVSMISALGFVREKMVELQQKMGETNSIVMDGRDIGTVVFPKADIKFFMTASPEIRAQRRFQEYRKKNENISFEEVLENVKKRDHIDETRAVSPLKKADDAVVLDNGNMTQEEQLQFIIHELENRRLIK